MIAEITLPLLFTIGLGPTKPPEKAQVAEAPMGAIVDRASQPVYVIAEGKAGARILLDEKTAPGLKEAAMTELIMSPGTVVPEHVHDVSSELLYVLEGHGVMTLGEKTITVRAGMAIWVPPGVKHGVRVDTQVEPMRALQIYTPGGPEQRFTKGTAFKE